MSVIQKIQRILAYLEKYSKKRTEESSGGFIKDDLRELEEKIMTSVKIKKKICPECGKAELIYESERGYICEYCDKKKGEKEEIVEIDTSIIYDPLVEDYTIKRIRT